MKRLLKIFLLLLTLLLALLLLYGCAQNSAEQSESVSESEFQPESSAPESSENSSEENKPDYGYLGTVFYIDSYIDIYKKAVETNETRPILIHNEDGVPNSIGEAPATEYWITGAESRLLIDHPFDTVYYSRNMPDWGGYEDTPKEYLELPVIIGCYRGDFYRYYLVDGAFVLDAHSGYSCYDPRFDNAPYSYRRTYYYYDSAIPYEGLKDSDGNVIFEPVHTSVSIVIPFKDRFLLGSGGFSPEERVSTLVDLDGNELAQFNWFKYKPFDEDGSYLGIAYSHGERDDLLGRCYDENGNVRERGYWFVDKDGKIVSPRFDELDGIYDIYSPSDIITAVDSSGNTIEIKASDYICKP